jgi:hypothetical protein
MQAESLMVNATATLTDAVTPIAPISCAAKGRLSSRPYYRPGRSTTGTSNTKNEEGECLCHQSMKLVPVRMAKSLNFVATRQ